MIVYTIVTVSHLQIGFWEPAAVPTVLIHSPALWSGGSQEVPADDPNLSNSTLKLGLLEDKPFVIYNYTLQGYKRCQGQPYPYNQGCRSRGDGGYISPPIFQIFANFKLKKAV